jgi:hypothetical protein
MTAARAVVIMIDTIISPCGLSGAFRERDRTPADIHHGQERFC